MMHSPIKSLKLGALIFLSALSVEFSSAEEGIIIVDEWEAEIQIGDLNWDEPFVIELENVTFVQFTHNTHYQNSVVVLDENHEQIWALNRGGQGSARIMAVAEDKFVLMLSATPSYRQDAVFYRIVGKEVTEVGRTSDFTKLDNKPATYVDSFGGFSDVASHEDYNDARYAELDTSINVRSLSWDGKKLIVRHYAFGNDGNQNNEKIKKPDVLFSGASNGNAIISWASQQGAKYQVQKSTDLESWINVGLPLDGTGEPMTYSEATEGGNLFFRLRIP